MAATVDENLMSGILSGMAQSFAASNALRINRADQLGADAASMWGIAMTMPTVSAGLGFRVASEAGASRTRAETNNPGNTAAPNIDAAGKTT